MVKLSINLESGMKFCFSLIVAAGLLGCLPRPVAEKSDTKATVSVCYKDFFSTLEGKKLSESMRAANEERSGLSLSEFGLNRVKNFLEPLYHTSASDRGFGGLRSRFAMLDVFNLYGYASPWVKWGIPDSLQVTAKKIEKVQNYLQATNKISNAPSEYRWSGSGWFSVGSHAWAIKNVLAVIVKNRDHIARLLQDNPNVLSTPAGSKTIQDLSTGIEDGFAAIEKQILDTKKSAPGYWEVVKKIHLEQEAELTRLSQEIGERLDADEEFLMAVSRFTTSPAETLIRGDNLLPISMARPHETIIRGADRSPIEFRSYIFVEGTREPVFDALHERGINMIVFLDGADGVERQMIFMSNDTGLTTAANTSSSTLNLTQKELSVLQKWRPEELPDASRGTSKTLTVLKLDEVAPDKFGPLARGIKEGDECPICMSDLPLAGDKSSAGGITFCPSCCRGFHPQCMLGWAQRKPKFTCPMCRGELTLETLIK